MRQFIRNIRPYPTFDGYPYLITRITPGFYHILPLPEERSEAELREVALRQHRANRIGAALCLTAEQALDIQPDESFRPLPKVPNGGPVFGGYLQACEDFPMTPELERRTEALARITAEVKERGGYLLGDCKKGGRTASEEELIRLAGYGTDGAPAGLERCDTCAEWRGECLDPSPDFSGLVMRVHCLCENDNRCARCWGLLAERRLNANEYDEERNAVMHQPGFSGLSHRCPEQAAQKS